MTPPFDRLKAALATRYDLTCEIGSGGMATVYLAEDLRHHRKVAVKVLRPELAASMGSERFFREIEIAARLQHPHILPLLDSGDADGFLYYVMPYVEGESLRERIARHGELPIPDAVRILGEVADALVHAHTHGVVHRDIKPENVLLSGRHALVTDFGVAKAVSEATGRQKLTTAGVALGTPAYMAPEQATADPQMDHRADLYALGVVAYEMLAGVPPFAGPTAQAVLSAHMTQEAPPIVQHRAKIPPILAEVVMRCLAKRPSDRWQTAQEIVERLELLATPSGGMTPMPTAPITVGARRVQRRVALAAGLVGAVIALAGVAVLALRSRAEPTLALGNRAAASLDPGVELFPALSPDGKLLAYAAGRRGELKIFVRQVGGGTPVPLTEHLPGYHMAPAWSPDGASLLFVSPRGLEVIPALGGQARLLVPAPPELARRGGPLSRLRGGTWSPDGRSVAFVRSDTLFSRGLAAGTERALATGPELDSPVWSPDGQWLAYAAGNADYVTIGNLAPSAVWVVSTRGGVPVRVTDDRSLNLSPAWVPGQRALLWVSNREGGRDVYQVALDPGGHPAGPAARLTTGLNAQTISLSADGHRLAYPLYTETSNVYVIRLARDRSRSVAEATPLTSGTQIIEGLGLSRDGQWLAFDSDRGGKQHIYRMRLPDGTPEQLTADSADDFLPGFSPDGRELVFHRIEHGVRDIFVMPADGGPATRIATNPLNDCCGRWAPDGRTIAYQCEIGNLNQICAIRGTQAGWGTPRELTHDGGGNPNFSPDGRWIAYGSISRPVKLFMIPSDGGEPREVVDPDAGDPGPNMILWSTDGRSLIYDAYAHGRVSVRIVPVAGGPSREVLHVDDPTSQSHRYGLAVHGDSLFFSFVNRQANIWVAEVRRER